MRLNRKGRFVLLNKKFHSGGFVFAEFAIALPLLIFLLYGLAAVGTKIFQLSRAQTADYILESEAQYVMERVTQEARVAKEIEIIPNADTDKIEIHYHTGGTDSKNDITIADIWETRFFIPHARKNKDGQSYFANINAKRADDGNESSPITGSIPDGKPNFAPFGDTKINRFKLDKQGKILHVSLEMESMDTGKKIRLNTAVFMPACED